MLRTCGKEDRWSLCWEDTPLLEHSGEAPFATAIRREKTYSANRGTVKEHITEVERLPLTDFSETDGTVTFFCGDHCLRMTVSPCDGGAELALNAASRCALGVFLGLGSAILSAVRLNGDVVFSEAVPLPVRAPAEETVRALAARLSELTERYAIPADSLLGLGAAVRGTISDDGRRVLSSFDALDTEDFPLCDRLEEYTGLPCILSNNVRALLAAQNYLDRRTTSGNCFFVRCDSGIGAALSIRGGVWEGDRRQCAEIGHIPVIRQGGKPCHCGKSGCLETVASPAAIREEALSRLSPEQTPLLWQRVRECGKDAVTVSDVLDAAGGGDAGAAAAERFLTNGGFRE